MVAGAAALKIDLAMSLNASFPRSAKPLPKNSFLLKFEKLALRFFHASIASRARLRSCSSRLSRSPMGGTSAEFAALIKSDLDKWSTIAKAANIQAE